jgi:hypothetical protein
MAAFDRFCEHEYGCEDHRTVQVTGFNWKQLDERIGETAEEDREEAVEVSQYSEALIAILSFLVGDVPSHEDSPFGISSRVLGLAFLINPGLVAGFKGLSDIARHCGVTRQALSKILLEFKDSADWKHARHFKSDDAREAYRVSATTGWRTRLANLQKRKEPAAAQASSESAIAE